MKAEEFFKLVVRMRNSQKEYFKTKTRSSLENSKHLEALVDKEIARVAQIRPDIIPTDPTMRDIFNQ